MHEHILAAIVWLGKAVAFGFIKPLHRPSRHYRH
jgi:hypothetical protein